jgi:hypothetical protein
MALIASPAGLLVAVRWRKELVIDLWFSISGSLIVAAGYSVWVLPAVQNMNEDTANQ